MSNCHYCILYTSFGYKYLEFQLFFDLFFANPLMMRREASKRLEMFKGNIICVIRKKSFINSIEKYYFTANSKMTITLTRLPEERLSSIICLKDSRKMIYKYNEKDERRRMKSYGEETLLKQWIATFLNLTKGVNFVPLLSVVKDRQLSLTSLFNFFNIFWILFDEANIRDWIATTSLNLTKGVNFVPCSNP